MTDNPGIKFQQEIIGLLVLHGSGAGTDIHHLHHAPIFVTQDVAMENISTGKIYEPGPHLGPASRRNREIVPPNPRFLEWYPGVLQRRVHIRRVKEGNNLKWIDVNMERMRRPRLGSVVEQRPFFRCAEFHKLIDFAAELFTVDGVHRRRVGP